MGPGTSRYPLYNLYGAGSGNPGTCFTRSDSGAAAATAHPAKKADAKSLTIVVMNLLESGFSDGCCNQACFVVSKKNTAKFKRQRVACAVISLQIVMQLSIVASEGAQSNSARVPHSGNCHCSQSHRAITQVDRPGTAQAAVHPMGRR